MDRFDAMAIFSAAVEQGSLAAAARRLGRSPATVTRAVALLEAHGGERLLHRSTRNLRLTEAGQRRLPVYRHVLAELAEADGAHTSRGLEGMLRVTASELFGRLKLMPVVESFLEAHPAVRARVLLLNRIVNLADEGVDLAVRLAQLPDSALITVRIGEVRRLVCASPNYLAKNDAPPAPHDLQGHACISEGEGGESALWRFAKRRGAPAMGTTSVHVEPRIALNSAGTSVDAAVRGHGLCQALSYQVADHLAAGRLVTLLHEFEPAPTPVQLVFHALPRRSGVLRAFIDYATPELRSELTRVAAVVSQAS